VKKHRMLLWLLPVVALVVLAVMAMRNKYNDAVHTSPVGEGKPDSGNCVAPTPPKSPGDVQPSLSARTDTPQSSAAPSQDLPSHKLIDVCHYGPRNTVLELAVGRDLTEGQARRLVAFYRAKYSDPFFVIDMFCDEKYANCRAGIDNSVPDSKYYAHLIYNYTDGPFGKKLYTPSDPINESQGSACARTR